MTGAVAQIGPVAAPAVDWAGLAPVVALAAGAIVAIMVRTLARRLPDWVDWAWTAAVGATAALSAAALWGRVGDEGPFNAVGDQFGVDRFSLLVTAVIAVSVTLVAPVLHGFCRREGWSGPEVYVLMLLSASGGVLMAGANDLVVLFLGLEILSIPAYVLAARSLARVQSLEAGLKYFVLGAFSSAFLLYGIALVYGATGTTNLAGIRDYLSRWVVLSDAMLLGGLALLLVGLGFKVAAVPFHAWVPDVYQGAPTPVAAFMASVVKTAGFAAVIRVFAVAFDLRSGDWQPAVYALAAATLLTGAVLAVVQRDVKRMLAYSSIAHAGFVLVGVQAASGRGIAAAVFYLAAYSALVIGTFSVLAAVSGPGDSRTGLDDLRGLNARRPALALAFTVLLLAQAGVPLTSGFVAKFEVIAAAVDARSFWLAVVAMVSAVISAFLYLRIMAAVYSSPGEGDEVDGGAAAGEPAEPLPVPVLTGVVVAVTVAVTVGIGVLPSILHDLARDAIPALVSAG